MSVSPVRHLPCPLCGSVRTPIRLGGGSQFLTRKGFRRSRNCLACGHTFLTTEIVGEHENAEPNEIARLRAEVRDLEQALEGSFYIRDSDSRNLAVRLNVSAQQGALLWALWTAPRPLSAAELDGLLPVVEKAERAVQTIRTIVADVRRKLGPIVWGKAYEGYRLTDEGKAMIAAALA